MLKRVTRARQLQQKAERDQAICKLQGLYHRWNARRQAHWAPAPKVIIFLQSLARRSGLSAQLCGGEL